MDKRDTSAPTLADVAQQAGVSTATVSRCLNAPSRVVPKTREKVMAAVEALGYAPNFSARALAAKRSYTVGAVIPTMENAIFARGIQAFQEELHAQGFTLLVASSLYRVAVEEEQIRALVSRGVDGLLLIGYDRGPQVYQFLQDRGVPAVIAWAHQSDQPHLSVGFDNFAAMKALAIEAIRLGHKRIGFISATLEGNDRARERVRGVQVAMKQQGLNPDALQVLETSYGVETGAEALRAMMRDAPDDKRPSLVMCGNDVLAVGALMAAKQLGLSVPSQLSITGFDDIEIARLVDPQLATVHVPHRDMGRKAACALVDRIHGKALEHLSQELDTYLCLRGTLGDYKL